MKHKFEAIKKAMIPRMDKFGFVAKGKDAFVKTEGAREVKIALSYRRGRGVGFESTIFISAMANIAFNNLNREERKVIDDVLTSYPVIGGSIKHYYEPDPGYLTIAANEEAKDDEVVQELMFYIENGAFHLFEEYPSLNKVLASIEGKDKNLDEYHKFLDFRSAIRLATIRYLVEGKGAAVAWFDSLEVFSEDLKKEVILGKMKSNWN